MPYSSSYMTTGLLVRISFRQSSAGRCTVSCDLSVSPRFLQHLPHSCQRNFLKGVHHLEAALVFRRQHRVARPVDHQGLHPSSDRSVNLLDVVAEEEDSGGLELRRTNK
jgi:hypothetical protein